MPPERPLQIDRPGSPSGDDSSRVAAARKAIDSTKQGIAWARQHPLKAAGVGAAGLLSVLLIVAVGGWLLFAGGKKGVTADDVFLELDEGAYARAKELAEQLRDQSNADPEDKATAIYALGVVAAREAEDTWNDQRDKKFLVAARYLEEARDRGFPPDRRSEGLWLLGKSLYESDQIPSARPVLVAALRAKPDEKWHIYRLLAGAYLQDRTPDLDKALHYNTLYLSHRMKPHQRDDGLLQRAQILLGMDKPDESVAVLGQIPKDSKRQAEATILRARITMDEASKLTAGANPTPQDLQLARRKYQQAIKTLRVAQGLDTLSNRATRKAMYLIGVCFQQLDDYRAALRQFARTRKLFPASPEGAASSFREGQISLQLGRDDDAVAGFRRAVEGLEDPDRYNNPWVPLDQLRDGMLEAYRHYMDTNNFKIALKLTGLFQPLFPESRALELTADVHERWGESLLSQAKQLPAADAVTFERRGRLHFREGGHLHRRLARLLVTTRQYPDELWEAANDYMRGQGFSAAIGVLMQYLKDQSRKRHPQALVFLGRAYLATGEIDKALDALQQCTEFHPRDAAAYEARLLASRAYQEKGEPDKAKKLLLKNLAGEYLTPASIEWRNSLFDLGELLLRQEEFEPASRRLEEAVTRYPDDPRADEARYLLAQSYQRAAKTLQEKLRQDLAGSTRLASSKQIGQLMNKALDQYIELRERLGRKQEDGQVSDHDRAILRNTYFAIGNIHFDLGQFGDAIESYSTITNRYQNHPSVLDAYVQIANAYRRLGQPLQAKSALEQAKIVLKRMNQETDFVAATNQDRQQWSQLLDELSKL